MAKWIEIAAAFFLPLVVSIRGCSSYDVVPDIFTFNFSHFESNSRNLMLRGNSSLMDTVLELTIRPSGVLTSIVGRAMYSTPVRLWDNVTGNLASFITGFTFSIKSSQAMYGDGFSFFLAPNGSYDTPNNSGGGYLGLIDYNQLDQSLPPSAAFIAVEVDTFRNSWDPPCLHIGIDINSITSIDFACVDWLDGKVQSGGQIHASITYNSRTGNLSAVLTDIDDPRNNSVVSQVVDLKGYLPEHVIVGFTAATDWSFELHTVHSWYFGTGIMIAASNEKPVPNKGKSATVTAISIVGGILFVSLILGLAWHRFPSWKETMFKLKTISSILDFGEVEVPKRFSYEELVNATDNFHEDLLLGQGGFGKVYEGILRVNGLRVAIKRISSATEQGVQGYATEVKTIGQLRHRNLVRLIGWCHKEDEEEKDLLLIYELMSNGSLDSHLFHCRTPLSWNTRYKILRDVALGLQYLHEGWARCVIHRDIKCSNILLDSDFCAKLGDFGLARLVDHYIGRYRTRVAAGTSGYMAPEYLHKGNASKESDVYSFGVVLLEIVCGREVNAGNGRENLVNWVRRLFYKGTVMEAVDESLRGSFNRMETKRVLMVGLWCSHPDFRFRPPIRVAINVLDFLSPLPTFTPSFRNGLFAGNSPVPPFAGTTTGS